jgi:hypothetical protein
MVNLLERLFYSVDAGGVRALSGAELKLKPGHEVYLGASSSPEHVIITKVDDKWISFRKYPYTKDQRIERPIGMDLIRTGISQHIKHHGADSKLTALLDGKDVPAGNVADAIANNMWHKVEVMPLYSKTDKVFEGRDVWDILSSYGSIGSHNDKSSPTGEIYDVNLPGRNLKDLKADKRFKIMYIKNLG